MHSEDDNQLANPSQWIVEMMPGFSDPPEFDIYIEDGDVLNLGALEIQASHTPGHTPGSTCYLHQDVVFTGDTLFYGTIGRHDLPGGDGELEVASIKSRLLTLPPETRVMPGHGPQTTIEQEARINPHLQ